LATTDPEFTLQCSDADGLEMGTASGQYSLPAQQFSKVNFWRTPGWRKHWV